MEPRLACLHSWETSKYDDLRIFVQPGKANRLPQIAARYEATFGQAFGRFPLRLPLQFPI
ncbi:MAG: hypothetical protein DLM68_05740 [Hyphomicrobiales bacterium]|nr:MAG: hypothetical protein DLM68_05740 [Hyphomicrobiales bacterium]